MSGFNDLIERFRSARIGGDGWSPSLAGAIVLGLAASGYYGQGSASNFVASLGLGGATLLIGILLGFLFGIPRYLQTDVSPSPDRSAGGDVGREQQKSRYAANTNLEQISDWLTKILVGVGLTQLVTLPDTFVKIGNFFGPAIGSGAAAPQVAISIVIYFSICGFLFGYLWTRIFLGGELAKADAQAVQDQLKTIAEQPEIDARASALVFQYLKARDVSKISVNEMKTAIEQSSPPIKVQVFYQTREVRSSNWSQDKEMMERTIPIFEALIASDTDRRFHQNHGQLGYALKDKRAPDYAGAERELSLAIDIRGSASEYGYRGYELNRAICRIEQDPNFPAGKPAAPENADRIWADIRAAGSSLPFSDDRVSKWQALNNASVPKLPG